MIKNFFARSASIAALAALAPVAAVYAQVTTSDARGVVTDSAGQPVAGATVTVVHQPTGTVTTATTGSNGLYTVQNLRIGGPFSFTVSGNDVVTSRVENVYTGLGETSVVNIVTAAADDTARLDTVVVTGSAAIANVATGPSSSYNLDTLENIPAISRDLKDALRLDPRIYIDDGFVDAISCAGANPRYNSLTVDGARLSDSFGLNSNGYPTESMPFSYDSIQQVSVELAPFDVEYGLFTACNINAVTKSGTNSFHGGLFFDYTNQDLRGDSVEGNKIATQDFEDKRYGFNIGGPIIQDKLFFFGSYEKNEAVNQFDNSPAFARVDPAVYQQVIDIAVNQYGYEAGGIPTSIPVEDEKIFAKLDWNITDRQRAAVSYTKNEAFNFNPSDSSTTQVSDGNHFYKRGGLLESYSASLNSDWTDNFNTELRFTRVEFDAVADPVVGNSGWGEVQVIVPNTAGGTSTIYLGADDSRHFNDLIYTSDVYKAKANWQLGDHRLTFGAEREELDVFNAFIQRTRGLWIFGQFANGGITGISDFAAGNIDDFRYQNAAGTNNPNDGAAQFGYEINTFYLQDKWQVTPALELTAGLRYDTYTSGDEPLLNPRFQTAYGFANNATMDGRDLLQPRLGFKYDYTNDIRFHGGIGLYSGGNPNVWISNNYSNNGVTLFDYRVRNRNLSTFTFGSGDPFFTVPDEAIAAMAAANASAGAGPVNALDPDFEIPSEWKAALGTVIDFGSADAWYGDDWRLMLDFLVSKTNEAAYVLPISFTQTRTAADGRPVYTGNTNDFLLTNAEEKGWARTVSVGLSKDYGNGIDWTAGYAFTQAKDVNPMTSSVAFSNWSNVQTFDPVNMDLGNSDYVIPHRFTFNLNLRKEFIKNFATKASLFATANEGAPYSYTIGSTNAFTVGNNSARNLAYIPTGVNDPVLSPSSNATAVQNLVNYINSNSDLSAMRGTIADRNSQTDPWRSRFDIRLAQEFPGLRADDRTEAFMVIRNVGNLLNDDWGVMKEHGFPGNAQLYGISGIDAQGRLIVTSFSPAVDNASAINSASLWQVRLGLKYTF
ncbi:outer membrane receptor (OMR) family protein [Hyphomonas polymorpha PS728]|uniref:Outer membrane receptor (OMR) family protein n=1 Tax=Hyphomonas polymorpha PS728 TaxID=1280954 RepID=A0A062VG70_9PROT|nr:MULTISPECIES: carboxypeptidase regulatory-like domain-containing protein [Hyphomonas]AXE65414.1 cell envelope biogenesis protein OmpA [Hyphomonas sp. CACIAM 19H1]KCZ97542.1 outer membrane receptor (OMR) family protein [Hyphomonas polymorpha PS728]